MVELRHSFVKMIPRVRVQAVNRELVVRAAKVRGVPDPVAVDATAGLGEDSLLLAAAGFDVLMYERNPTIAAALRAALEEASDLPELAGIARRMSLVEGDSVRALGGLDFTPDVVFLDPMFPARHKSAAVKKKLQQLQQLEEPCEDEGELLDAAFSAHPRKVVVKRPAKGPHLAARVPAYSLSGKAVRFDVYLPQ